jgi:hypothetical protein
MKYFYDTEFIEDGKTIDLISIGIVAEDGRTYYAISTEFYPKKASQWVIDNVLSKLPPRWVTEQDSPRTREESNAWKTRKQIKEDIIAFIGEDKPEFWAYYADYDHVALCQLFGKMMDLPKGYPMYTNDIKQLCNYKGNPQLPKTDNEHNALDDAKWNMNMFYLLNSDQREHITDMPHCWCNPKKTVYPNGNMVITHN